MLEFSTNSASLKISIEYEKMLQVMEVVMEKDAIGKKETKRGRDKVRGHIFVLRYDKEMRILLSKQRKCENIELTT